jgi:Fe-Mn family superoxide dismutase
MFILPELPYGYDSLAPTLGETTLRTHHDKHHAKYVSVANELLAKSGAAPESLEALVLQASAEGDKKMFNNAGQAWNHGFFWESMTPSYAAPTGALLAAIEAGHGDVDSLKAKFVAEGVGHFGSGWVWLLAKGGELSVASTHDGITSLEVDATPLLVCDLWEHAYYLDYKNDREGFLKAWWDKLANFAFAEKQLAGDTWTYPAPTAG